MRIFFGIIFFVVTFFVNAQEVTFKIKKDSLTEVQAVSNEVKFTSFAFNDSINSGFLSKKYFMKNGLKLTPSNNDVKVFCYEVRCENREGYYKNFTIKGDQIPKKTLRKINRMPNNGITLIVGAIRISNEEIITKNAYNSIYMILRLIK